jgi:hypothetical protein
MRLAGGLLKDGPAPIDQRAAANELYGFFDALAGHPQDAVGTIAKPWQTETLLPTGKAINPFSAATCLLDYARTMAFARGVNAAIRAARDRFPGERIEVLYAGSGPFAPLALLQTQAFAAEQVRFTLIDAHRPALDCVAGIVSKLGLDAYIEEPVHADAAAWTPAGGKRYHVVVAEVMQRALKVEPQVAVTLNLSPHLRAGGFLVPERIDLSLCMLNPGTEFQLAEAASEPLADYLDKGGFFPPEPPPADGLPTDTDSLLFRQRVEIATPFTLSRTSAAELVVPDDGRIRRPNVRLPETLHPGHVLRILTKITTFAGITLGDYESGLTFPDTPSDVITPVPGMWLEVWYETRGTPGLRLEPLAAPTPPSGV